jgi:hypothetical protein
LCWLKLADEVAQDLPLDEAPRAVDLLEKPG